MRRENTIVALKAIFLLILVCVGLFYAVVGLFSLSRLSDEQRTEIKKSVALHLEADNNTEVEVSEPVSIFLGKGVVRIEAKFLNLKCSRVHREFVVRGMLGSQRWTITPSKVLSVTPYANCALRTSKN